MNKGPAPGASREQGRGSSHDEAEATHHHPASVDAATQGLLLPQHADLIRASAIAAEVAEARGYRSVTSKAELARRGFSLAQQRVTGLLIPLHGVAGGVVGYQLRPDVPRIDRKGKTLKYESPRGSKLVLDVPPSAKESLTDPNITLWVTEGSRKADSAVSAGLCCISLLGVWSWRGKNSKGGKAALPDWDSIPLNNGRPVFLAFDSDVIEKPEVSQALGRLKGFLEGRGAAVRIIRLPHGDDGAKVGLDDYLAAGHTVEELKALACDELPAPDGGVAARYFHKDGSTWWNKPTREGHVPVLLANFAARIVSQERMDDGAEVTSRFSISGELAGGKVLPMTRVSADRFAGMGWVVAEWGVRAVVQAGMGLRDHLRAAIQELSGDTLTQTVYQHLGWRKVEAGWVYLHAGGAVGEAGLYPDIRVEPEERRLHQYQLPEPPKGEVSARAARASLGLLDLAPRIITIPLLAGIYRAPLDEALPVDFALFLSGQSGCQKTELIALAQAHWGRDFSGRNLPASWSATANALERMAFLAKDAVLVIDDFAPGNSTMDVQRLHREADRLLRAQGNRSGRGRMRADGSLRPEYFPRGLIVASGEDVPAGQSLRARIFILELERGAVDLRRLTSAQSAAAEGEYATAMAGYVQWLAGQMDKLKAGLPDRFRELRNAARDDHFAHDRTPDIRASLALGMEVMLAFMRETGAITREAAERLWVESWAALGEAAEAQASAQASEDPARRFLALLTALLSNGDAHVADGLSGESPQCPADWGWHKNVNGAGVVWKAQGARVGWIAGDDLLLEPEAVFAAVQDLSGRQGFRLPITARTLWRRLREAGFLASTDDGKSTIKRTLAGRRMRVLHIPMAALSQDPGAMGAIGATPHDTRLHCAPVAESSGADAPINGGEEVPPVAGNPGRVPPLFGEVPPLKTQWGRKNGPETRVNSVTAPNAPIAPISQA